MTYWDWERRTPFETKAGTVFPLYSQGINGDMGPIGGKVWAFSADVRLEDCEYPEGLRCRVGYLEWHRATIEYVATVPAWQRKGVATGLLALAREICPTLRHAERRTEAAESWIAVVDPLEVCAVDIGEPVRVDVRPRRSAIAWVSGLLQRGQRR